MERRRSGLSHPTMRGAQSLVELDACNMVRNQRYPSHILVIVNYLGYLVLDDLFDMLRKISSPKPARLQIDLLSFIVNFLSDFLSRVHLVTLFFGLLALPPPPGGKRGSILVGKLDCAAICKWVESGMFRDRERKTASRASVCAARCKAPSTSPYWWPRTWLQRSLHD